MPDPTSTEAQQDSQGQEFQTPPVGDELNIGQQIEQANAVLIEGMNTALPFKRAGWLRRICKVGQKSVDALIEIEPEKTWLRVWLERPSVGYKASSHILLCYDTLTYLNLGPKITPEKDHGTRVAAKYDPRIKRTWLEKAVNTPEDKLERLRQLGSWVLAINLESKFKHVPRSPAIPTSDLQPL